MEIPVLGLSVTLNDDPQLESVCYTIFFANCPHKCKNCHNPQSWDINNSTLMTLEEIKEKIENASKLVRCICFCGGEPLLYPEAIKELTKFCKTLGLKRVLYTGYLFEEIDKDIIRDIDIIVDGKYVDELKQNTFPASKNQRVFINGKQLSEIEIKELYINYAKY